MIGDVYRTKISSKVPGYMSRQSICNNINCNSNLYYNKEYVVSDLSGGKITDITQNKKGKKIVIIGGVAAGTVLHQKQEE